MPSKDHLQEEPLEFKGLFAATVGIIVVIAAVVFGFNWVNEQRSLRVVAKYDKSVEEFVGANSKQLALLYTEVFDACDTFFQQTIKTPPASATTTGCVEAETLLDQLDKTKLKDHSSTAFLRVRNDRIQTLQWSALYEGNDMYAYSLGLDRKKVLDILRGDEVNRWQDFSWMLPGKEVLSPVRVDDQVIGYMLLSVIEK
jgi:hypothetical protein